MLLKVLVRVDVGHSEQFENSCFDVRADGALEVRDARTEGSSALLGVFKDWQYARYIGDGEVEFFIEAVAKNVQEKLKRRGI